MKIEDSFGHLAGHRGLKDWLARHLELFQEESPLAPGGIVLVGLPGTGKRSVAGAIAAAIGRPLVRFVPGEPLELGKVLLIEDLDLKHQPLVRRLSDREDAMPFVIATTERPWELPAGLLRADAIDAVWHLDLPDMKERAAIWDLAARRQGVGAPLFDPVLLARASHEFTPGEIHAVFMRAKRTNRTRDPRERDLLDALAGMCPQVHARQADLLKMTHWCRLGAYLSREE